MQSFQSLFSTLVQVIATLLSVLFAFISAYYVFLQDRATQYEDKIESAKLEIRNALLQIRSNWPWTLSLFVPPEFQDKYRAKYPEKSESDFVIQMITDLVFEAQEIRDALADAGASNSIEGHWQGRLYMLALTKAVTAITVGTPDSRTKPEKVFPSSADGMGYDQWRAQFNKIDQTIQLLSTFQASMREDYFLWASTRYNEKVARGEAERYQIALDGLFKRIQSVKDELREIDKQESLQKRYSFSQRIHEGPLLALIVLSIALGIGAPLVLLALPQWEMTSITAIVIIFLAGLSTLGAFIQFGWDVKKPVVVDSKEYVAKRWYLPLLKELDRQKTSFENGGLLDLEYFTNARNSDEKALFGEKTRDALQSFVQDADKYNEKALAFDKKVLEAVRAHSVLGPATSGYKGNRGGRVLYPTNFLDQEKLRDAAKNFDANADILIEVLMPRWTQSAVKIPGSDFASQRLTLKQAFDDVRLQVYQSSEAEVFKSAKETVRGSMERLQQAIKSTT